MNLPYPLQSNTGTHLHWIGIVCLQKVVDNIFQKIGRLVRSKFIIEMWINDILQTY